MKPEDIFFSVVMPLYNKQNTVIRAVSSVILQNYKEFELIIVDDGSTDKSLDVVNSVVDDRVKIISQKNRGVSAARNEGLKSAHGQFVCFLDADDVWMPDHLTTIHNLVRKSPSASLYSCRHSVVDENGHKFLRKPYSKLSDYEGILPNFFKVYKSLEIVNSSTAVVARRSLSNIGGFPEGSGRGEDIWTWLRLADLGSVCYSDRVTAVIHRDSENRSGSINSFEVPIHILKLRNGLVEISDYNKTKVASFICYNAIKQALGCFLRGQRSGAFSIARCLYRSCFICGFFITIMSIFPASIYSIIKTARNR